MRFLRPFYDPTLYGPSSWPRAVRRGYLLTLPISGPVYIAICTVIVAAMVVGGVIGFAVLTAFEASSGILDDVRTMWSRP